MTWSGRLPVFLLTYPSTSLSPRREGGREGGEGEREGEREEEE